jgi:hypothetical protein
MSPPESFSFSFSFLFILSLSLSPRPFLTKENENENDSGGDITLSGTLRRQERCRRAGVFLPTRRSRNQTKQINREWTRIKPGRF